MLLDTATLLWVLTDSPRLGAAARERVAAATLVHVSAVSLAETAIKAMLGKLVLPADFATQVTGFGFVSLAFTIEDADTLAAFPELARHDPFDRMLVAQAHRRGMDFLTPDRRLLALDRPGIVDATR